MNGRQLSFDSVGYLAECGDYLRRDSRKDRFSGYGSLPGLFLVFQKGAMQVEKRYCRSAGC